MPELTLTINIEIDHTGRLEASACKAFTGNLQLPFRYEGWADSPDELRALALIAMLPLAHKYASHHLPPQANKDLENAVRSVYDLSTDGRGGIK